MPPRELQAIKCNTKFIAVWTDPRSMFMCDRRAPGNRRSRRGPFLCALYYTRDRDRERAVHGVLIKINDYEINKHKLGVRKSLKLHVFIDGDSVEAGRPAFGGDLNGPRGQFIVSGRPCNASVRLRRVRNCAAFTRDEAYCIHIQLYST